jgi:hypothetical protein
LGRTTCPLLDNVTVMPYRLTFLNVSQDLFRAAFFCACAGKWSLATG